MTPEQYHLTNGPTVRESLRKESEAMRPKVSKEAEQLLRSHAARLGIRIPKSAKFSDGRLAIGPLYIGTLWRRDMSVTEGPVSEQFDLLERKRKRLCAELSTAGARRFGAWCRAKYGKNPTDQVIKKAYGEWLEFISNCVC